MTGSKDWGNRDEDGEPRGMKKDEKVENHRQQERNKCTLLLWHKAIYPEKGCKMVEEMQNGRRHAKR